MGRALGQFALALIAVYSAAVIVERLTRAPVHAAPIPEAAPICFTIAAGFLALIAATGERSRPASR
jgi:hypothetical protein